MIRTGSLTRRPVLGGAMLSLALLLAASLPAAVPSQAQAAPTITLAADKDSYVPGETIVISGTVSEAVERGHIPEFVHITVTGPGGHYGALRVLPDSSLKFSGEIALDATRTTIGGYSLLAEYAGASDALSIFVVEAQTEQPDPRILLSTDRRTYLPGQYAEILLDVEPINSVPMLVTVTNPAGSVVFEQTLYPTTSQGVGRVQTTVQFHVGQTNNAVGTYWISASHADYQTSEFIVLQRTENPTIGLYAGGGILVPGQTVWIRGTSDDSASVPVAIEIAQHPDTARPLYISDETTSAADGTFSYEFVLPPGPGGLGSYSITAFTLSESGTLDISVSGDPRPLGSLDDQLEIATDRAFYRAGQNMSVSGMVANASAAGVDLMVYPAGDPAGLPLPSVSVASIDGESFGGSIPLEPGVFAPGEYWLRASYHGGLLTGDRFFVVTDGDSAGPALHIRLDRQVYGTDDRVSITGIYGGESAGSADGETVHYTLTPQQGHPYYFRSAISGDDFSAVWDTSTRANPLGSYTLETRVGDARSLLNFEVSESLEGSSAPALTVETDKTFYKSGDTLVASGTALHEDDYSIGATLKRVKVEMDFGAGISPFVANVIAEGNTYETAFPLPTNVIPSGKYTIRASYLDNTAESQFPVGDLPGEDGPELLLSLDSSKYVPGDTVSATGGPERLVYMESFSIQVIRQSAGGPDCGSIVCGLEIASTTIPADTEFRLDLILPDDEPVGLYELVVDAGYANRSAIFEVVPPPPPPVRVPPQLVEKFDRIPDSSVSIVVGERMEAGVRYVPYEIAGLLVSAGAGPSGVLLLDPDGQCTIGLDADCTLARPALGSDSAASDHAVSYERVNALAERFSVSALSADSISGGVWIVVAPEDSGTRLYYTVTYMPVLRDAE